VDAALEGSDGASCPLGRVDHYHKQASLCSVGRRLTAQPSSRSAIRSLCVIWKSGLDSMPTKFRWLRIPVMNSP
jgi:hypothetical protein